MTILASMFLTINEVGQLLVSPAAVRSFSLVKDLAKFPTHLCTEGFVFLTD